MPTSTLFTHHPHPYIEERRNHGPIKVANQLRGSVFTPALFDKVVAIADNPLAK